MAEVPAWTANTMEAGAADASVGDGQGGAWGYLLELRPGLGPGPKQSTTDAPLPCLELRDGVTTIGLGNVRVLMLH